MEYLDNMLKKNKAENVEYMIQIKLNFSIKQWHCIVWNLYYFLFIPKNAIIYLVFWYFNMVFNKNEFDPKLLDIVYQLF